VVITNNNKENTSVGWFSLFSRINGFSFLYLYVRIRSVLDFKKRGFMRIVSSIIFLSREINNFQAWRFSTINKQLLSWPILTSQISKIWIFIFGGFFWIFFLTKKKTLNVFQTLLQIILTLLLSFHLSQ
jgi:hypothetical protein